METVAGLQRLAEGALAGAVVTIGNFDGVHLGHRALLAGARGVADAGGGNGGRGTPTQGHAARVVVVTFDRNPGAVIRGGEGPARLTTLGVRERLLREAGADEVVVLGATPEVLGVEARAFFEVLVRAGVAHLVEGEDFCFGRGRAGSIGRLREWCPAAGVGLTVVPPVRAALMDGSVVSVGSSLIRFLAMAGRVRDAGICLGGALRVCGRVVEGAKRGRTIGFPTANIAVEGVVPGDGVYGGACEVDGVRYPVAMNVGAAPTFGVSTRTVEAHLVGYAGDLYGREIEVEVLAFLRDGRKFLGVEALTDQLARDVGGAVKAFATEMRGSPWRLS